MWRSCSNADFFEKCPAVISFGLSDTVRSKDFSSANAGTPKDSLSEPQVAFNSFSGQHGNTFKGKETHEAKKNMNCLDTIHQCYCFCSSWDWPSNVRALQKVPHSNPGCHSFRGNTILLGSAVMRRGDTKRHHRPPGCRASWPGAQSSPWAHPTSVQQTRLEAVRVLSWQRPQHSYTGVSGSRDGLTNAAPETESSSCRRAAHRSDDHTNLSLHPQSHNVSWHRPGVSSTGQNWFPFDPRWKSARLQPLGWVRRNPGPQVSVGLNWTRIQLQVFWVDLSNSSKTQSWSPLRHHPPPGCGLCFFRCV